MRVLRILLLQTGLVDFKVAGFLCLVAMPSNGACYKIPSLDERTSPKQMTNRFTTGC